ncbi:hypothetical protein BB559_001852 [Furculomyces boomerangus]|uniref:Alpha-aminoadipate reductase n=1 Tax=Furculomyces boomerangus TaxID=61424 RepID=A0A2T9Z046_9FUNG|nr:hypothetical protein BB559_001852 [Furculomyces boomerangus]
MTNITSLPSDNVEEVNRRLQLLTRTLESPNEVLLPTDYPRPVPLKVVEAAEDFTLPPNLSMGVMQLVLASQKNDFLLSSLSENSSTPNIATPFTVLLTAFAILLYRYTASEDVVVGSSSETSNALVLRLKIQPEDTFMDVFEMVKRVEQEAIDNQVPFESLIKAVAEQLTRSGVVSKQESEAAALYSLFRVRFFNMSDTNDTMLNQTISSSTDLTVFISQESTTSLRQLYPSVKVRLVYNQVLFSGTRMRHLWEQLLNVLSVGLSTAINPNQADIHPEHRVGSINLLSTLGNSTIPNPHANLHWSDFPGSITEIFCKNTMAHPDKKLISESTISYTTKNNNSTLSTDKVIFTYLQTFNAARIISRHLRINGIQRGDVVVVYAYRSADLAVAIMGVLMAGATFSVIDPAYPPARQNIYLSVAKPKGLVVLDKAGKLHEEVRNYVKNELQVICQIDGVYLDSTGKLNSRITSIEEARKLVSQSTNLMDDVVEVGPDSIGTLSFTSGSTGIPKGVQGRHYSLTHFYPWMQTEFGLGSSDKFTMLSGIAHDPIQRDIFTPLFLGAELHIPTSEDIGIPGQLAEWMAQNQITVTNLTPAMGQLLSSNAVTPIPNLKAAFFVGDLLTRRDCNRIQSLAPNCTIVNMYGTTETQRAVSYFPIPPLSTHPAALSSMKEIIPAGKGMIDVQLLVVNVNCRTNLCGIGEVGEIYVRSSGLAEGYLRLEEATKEKFVHSWFTEGTDLSSKEDQHHDHYLGPRDRLYRTGDLGRYRPDGNVECIGRIDDQVKIRGFRIELGEINNILSLYPQLVSSVVLVRRDKYEEQTLVAYIVPDEKEQLRTDDPSRSKLIEGVREYLKQKLPNYSIPSVFVPMKKLPLTPNGKVDKAALPFPDTPMFRKGASVSTEAMLSGSGENPDLMAEIFKELGPTGQKLVSIWINLLHLPKNVNINKNSNFFDLGGHSILATRLVFRIRKELTGDAPLGLVYQCPTLLKMTQAIDEMKGDLKLSNPLQKVSGENSPILGREQSVINLQEMHQTNGKGETFSYEKVIDYSGDFEDLANQIPELTGNANGALFPVSVSTNNNLNSSQGQRKPPVFLLTGATGFLGAYVLSNIISRHKNAIVYCLTRAKSEQQAMDRVKNAGLSNFVWESTWETNNQVRALVGDLSLPHLGLDDSNWELVCSEVDVIVHNGALVNWVWPYEKLRAPNVLGTLEAIKLSSEHHPKPLVFVSSTSVLDTPHYVQVGESSLNGVEERDNLEGSRVGLRSGYGQSKWVSEKLLSRAKEMGYPVTIVRPGYVVGDSKNGVTNTDDFVWRLVKGCVELGKSPAMNNVVNLCPVDYVAQVVVEAASLPSSLDNLVYHVFNKQQFRFQNLFDLISLYGYDISNTEYIEWRDALLTYTVSESTNEDSALFPLLHFVLDDLPTSTRAPDLDISNTSRLMEHSGITCPDINKLIGIYLAYLVKAKFLDPPSIKNPKRQLPELSFDVKGTFSRSSN